MKFRFRFLMIMAMPLAACQSGMTTVADSDDDMSDLMAQLSGSFSAPASEGAAPFGELVDRRVVVDAPSLGKNVLYWQVNRGAQQELYRQRLLVFDRDKKSGAIVQTSWSFKDPKPFQDVFDSPGVFVGLGEADLSSPVARECLQVWRRTATGWVGRVDPAECRIWSSRRESWRRIESEVEVSAGGMWLVERGYDDNMKQVFGTPQGERLWLDRSP